MTGSGDSTANAARANSGRRARAGGGGVRRLSGHDPARQARAAEDVLRPQGCRRHVRVRDRECRPDGVQPADRGPRPGARERRDPDDEAGNVAAASRIVDDRAVSDYFEHEGHRTVVSQRALQQHTDPLLGYTTLDGVGYVVADLSPYEADLDWSQITEPEEISPVVADLGRATAKIHCISDSDSEEDLVEFSTEDAIAAVLDGAEDAFVEDITDFGIDYAQRARRDHALFVDAFRGGQLRPRVGDLSSLAVAARGLGRRPSSATRRSCAGRVWCTTSAAWASPTRSGTSRGTHPCRARAGAPAPVPDRADARFSQPRTVSLLAPLREDLASWRKAQAQALPSAPLFPAASGTFWRATDWRNCRKRSYKPAAEAVGINGARPYDLRHAFASLLIDEGRLSVVEIAAQLGHKADRVPRRLRPCDGRAAASASPRWSRSGSRARSTLHVHVLHCICLLLFACGRRPPPRLRDARNRRRGARRPRWHDRAPHWPSDRSARPTRNLAVGLGSA